MRKHTRHNADYKRKGEVAKKGETFVCVPESASIRRSLISNGVRKQVFSIPPFVLENYVSNFISEVEGLKPKSVSKKKQLDKINPILQNPFKGAYTCCISSKPNDLKAKLLGVHIMSRAVAIYNDKSKQDEKTKKKLEHKAAPLFYNVMGWSKNEIFDRNSTPSLIVFSNLPANMTPHKLEKLRDMMEAFSNIPRIVVTTGHDPVTFFNASLFMGLNVGCLLTDSNVKKVHEL